MLWLQIELSDIISCGRWRVAVIRSSEYIPSYTHLAHLTHIDFHKRSLTLIIILTTTVTKSLCQYNLTFLLICFGTTHSTNELAAGVFVVLRGPDLFAICSHP